jgi:formylglycine-generating enzyme required for sulfatase activity
VSDRWVSRISAAVAAAFLLAFASCRKVEQQSAAAVSAESVTTAGGVEMVLVPGGQFTMGSAQKGEADESPHKVQISPFSMDRYEVTQEEYERVMGENPSKWKGPKNPVEQIRWPNAIRYCNARSRLEGLEPAYDLQTGACNFEASGYRLPTEAEWEYAARAGTTTEYSFGNDPAELKRYGWFKGSCPLRRPSPVGQKEPNAWGLYDLSGNVCEWCNDFYQEDYYQHSPDTDPRGPTSGEARILRGGSWNSNADECRPAYRLYEDPVYRDICFARDVHGLIGFRCVRKAAGATK